MNLVNFKKLIFLMLFYVCSVSAWAEQFAGKIDGFYPGENGNPVLSGWACKTGDSSSISVDLYLNSAYPSGQFVKRFEANVMSEPAVSSACNTTGQNFRFAIPLAGLPAGVLVYVHAISQDGATGLLQGSGNFKIPANYNSALKPGSVSLGTQFVLYDAGVDANSGCAPFLDSPIYPVSFASESGNGYKLSLNVVSLLKGDNYWVEGGMDVEGRETVPLRVNCNAIILQSPRDPDGAHYKGSQWLAGFTKQPDGSLYAIVHNEFYGGLYPSGADFVIPSTPQCGNAEKTINPFNCTYTVLDAAVMPSGSSEFHLLGDESNQVIARPSFDYKPNAGQPTGYFTNTNILKNSDGYYYALTSETLLDGSQRRCPIRTSDITNPSLWRGWGGADFTVNIPQGADCNDVGLAGIFPFYLGYNSYFGKFIMIGAYPVTGTTGQMAYSLSMDMVHWSQAVSFTIPIFDGASGGWSQNNYPSLFDPAALSQTQDGNASSGAVTGQVPWLVFVQRNGALQTRAVAIPVAFSQ